MLNKEAAGTWNRKSVFAAIDLAPTLLTLASVDGVEQAEFDGEALSGVLKGTTETSRQQPLFFRRPPDRDAFYGDDDLPDLAVREGNWKLLCEYDGSDAELFDLAADPSETKNVAGSHAEIVEQLTKQLVAWHKAMPQDNGATYKERRRR